MNAGGEAVGIAGAGGAAAGEEAAGALGDHYPGVCVYACALESAWSWTFVRSTFALPLPVSVAIVLSGRGSSFVPKCSRHLSRVAGCQRPPEPLCRQPAFAEELFLGLGHFSIPVCARNIFTRAMRPLLYTAWCRFRRLNSPSSLPCTSIRSKVDPIGALEECGTLLRLDGKN